MKARRWAAIRDIVEREAVHSQEQLRQRLGALGFDVTQATLSRDIKGLGFVKRAADGAYQAPATDGAPPEAAGVTLARALAEYLAGIARTEQLLVLKTGPGQAQLLALALDRARFPEVLGTIGGDDTILVICRDPRAAEATRRALERLAAGR